MPSRDPSDKKALRLGILLMLAGLLAGAGLSGGAIYWFLVRPAQEERDELKQAKNRVEGQLSAAQQALTTAETNAEKDKKAAEEKTRLTQASLQEVTKERDQAKGALELAKTAKDDAEKKAREAVAQAAKATKEAKDAELSAKGQLDKVNGELTKVMAKVATAEKAKADAEKARDEARLAEKAAQENLKNATANLAKATQDLASAKEKLKVAEKVARKAIRDLAVVGASLELGGTPPDVLGLIDRELADQDGGLTAVDRATLGLARAKLLVQSAQSLRGQGKAEEAAKALVRAAGSAKVAADLAKKERLPLGFLTQFYRGVALEALERFDDALQAYKEAETLASNETEKNRCRAAAARVITDKALKKEPTKPEKGTTLPPGRDAFLALVLVAVQVSGGISSQERQRLERALAEIESNIKEAGDKVPPGLFLAKAKLLQKLERNDAAVEAILAGIKAQEKTPPLAEDNFPQGCLNVLVEALRRRKPTPVEEKTKDLQRQLDGAQARLGESQNKVKTLTEEVNAVRGKLETAQKDVATAREQLTTAKTKLGETTKELNKTKVSLEQSKTKGGGRGGDGLVPLADRSLLVADVPPGATLSIDGKHHSAGQGTTREFLTPRLDPGQDYPHELRVEMVKDGKTLRATRKLVLRAGREVRLSLQPGKDEESLPVVTPLNRRALLVAVVPPGSRLLIDQTPHPEKDQGVREFITPPLERGRMYVYRLSVEPASGEAGKASRQVTFQAGDVVWVPLNGDNTGR